MHAAEQRRPDVAKKRKHWHEQFENVSSRALVFVDESGANTQMARLRGRCAVGQRLVARVPHGSYRTSTLIAAVRLAGSRSPWVLEGSLNGEMFLAWVNKALVPVLKKGDAVIMDNLATHKVRGVREAIEAAGARLLYLPPYSPDFNPIENMWSKIKQTLRSLAPRNQNQLLEATRSAFASISKADCRGFFSHAQYAT